MACYAEAVIAVAEGEVGYLEKKTNAQLDDKTANAGYNNFTKYWRDTYPAFQGQPWCDDYIDWLFIATYGKEKADELLCGGSGSYYTVNSAKLFQNQGRLDRIPKKGDKVFFSRDGTVEGIYHTGLVRNLDNNYIYTNEGNTSSTSGIVPNGGGVWNKKYLRYLYQGKMWFGHPKYDVKKEEKPVTVSYYATVNVKTHLKVRTGPGVSYPEFMLDSGDGTWTPWRFPPAARVHIVEEKDGWGRVGDTIGWVSLAYLKR